MTEYGRSPGSEPWHPEDPLFGDQGWGGQQAGGREQYYQQQAQDPYQQGQYGGHQDQYGQEYAQQQPQYADPQYGGTGQGAQGYDEPGYPAQPYDGTWEASTGQQVAMPYSAPPAEPYSAGSGPDLYGTPEAFPPPQPPGQRQTPPEPASGWQAEPEAEEGDSFFSGGGDGGRGDDDSDDPAGRRSGGRGRGGRNKKKRGRNGIACLVVATVLVGGLGGVGYFGYQFWQGQFGAAPDFTGEGAGSVEVVIPKDAGGYDIGNILKKNGVVKSVDAFVSAQERNPKGKMIQDGVYILKKGMSAASAVELMLNPVSRSNFIIPEGKRNVWVYAEIDKRLGLKAGTTAGVAKTRAKSLGLPAWANGHANVKDPLEGFLFPASYPVAKGAEPEDVLRKMVARANEEFDKLDLQSKATSLGLKSPWELVTVASLVQAEGKTHDDFRKMGEVVYNRLKPTNTETNQLLQFDSAFNYLKGQSKIKISESEINSNQDPYNTYTQKGLTPGPIGNPGNDALAAALNPTKDGWLYFVATDGMNKTEFAKTHTEFLTLKEKFDANSGSN